MKVYLLMHARELEDDAEEIKTLGIYSSEETVEAAILRYRELPGFRDYPEDFFVSEFEVDEDDWTEGFVTPGPEDA
jgi:hypothetical protein